MALKSFFIFIFVNYLNTVFLQPKVVYKPTEFPYSKCFENGTNRLNCERLNMSYGRQEKESVWPPGPYAIPMCKYGCPESQSRGWSKSNLKVRMVELIKNSESVSSVLGRNWDPDSSYINDDYFKSPHGLENWTLFYFCVKFRNDTALDKEQWISGNYSIYKIGSSCPTGFEESTKTLPVTEFVSHGQVPDIAVSEKGNSEMLTKILHISICKRKKLADMGYVHTNETFRLLETDFILEKEADTNCSQFNVTTVSQGATHCFYNPKVQSIDYETATELILNQRTLYKLHQDNDFEWYFIDCKRSLEIVMIDIKSSHLENIYFKCFISDVPGNLGESAVCNTETTTLPGKLYLRRTQGRFFTFALKASIAGDMSFQVFISSIEAQNGEPCFESIEIDNKHVPNSQITVSSGTTTQIPTNTNTIFTGWIHDATDLTPWILIDLIDVTTIEGVSVHVSKDCDMRTTFSLYFGNNKDTLQLYKVMEFRTFQYENWWDIDQVFILPRPINGRYAKFKHSLEKPTRRSRCLNFKFFGCKLTHLS
ncbi:uncharacterized protein LOC132757886 [Ruditapes philippinarum]|uniref:uncharacterized protein LOC132757886 n=1 Tax=Ruditapes philippinarum TaxID=129788 RepID=UPI00295A671F|nr:uncharacterized protein LOC132757886 [Ruditapes philippinarum]